MIIDEKIIIYYYFIIIYTVWEKEMDRCILAPENEKPTQTLHQHLCNRIVARHKEVLCGRSCYGNSKVCERTASSTTQKMPAEKKKNMIKFQGHLWKFYAL